MELDVDLAWNSNWSLLKEPKMCCMFAVPENAVDKQPFFCCWLFSYEVA